MVLFAVAGVVATVGLCLCLWGVYLYLAVTLSGALAALLTGLTGLLMAGGMVWAGQRISQ